MTLRLFDTACRAVREFQPVTQGKASDLVDTLVGLALRQREAARGDYASADSIRDRPEVSGVVVEDTPAGTRWELARQTRRT